MTKQARTADLVLFITTVALLCIGIVMVYSASSVKAYQQYHDSMFFLKRQLLWAVVGIVAMLTTMRIDYQIYRKWAWPILLGTVGLLVLVILIGADIRGSKAWINLGFLSIQPTEIAKLALVLFISAYFTRRQDQVGSLWHGLLPPLGILGIVLALIMLQPDFGSVLAIAATAFIIFIAAGFRTWQLTLLALASVPVFVALAIAEPYRLRRLLAFLDPWKDPLDTGYQTIQSLMALGSGGLFGLGLGQSRQKFNYLPENHTDFIFAILGEELGLIGTLGILLLIFLFAWRGFKIAITAPDYFGSLVAVGVTSMIVFQALMNIGIISGVLPITGVTLPLVSYGGSSLAITLAGIGILLNISKYSSPR